MVRCCLATTFTFSLLEWKKLNTFCMKHHYDDSYDTNPGNKLVGVPSVMKYMINLE